MKTKIAFLSIVLTIVFSLPMFGQQTEAGKSKTGMKHHEMMSMMGKTTFEATSQGVHFKIWLTTQEENKKMMAERNESMDKDMKMDKDMGMDKDMKMDKDMMGMGEKGMGMDKDTRLAMMAGTHHIALLLTDASSGKEITNASASILIVSPSKKDASVELRTGMMKDHFGAGITLAEKGEYQFTVNAKIGTDTKTTQFKYTVK